METILKSKQRHTSKFITGSNFLDLVKIALKEGFKCEFFNANKAYFTSKDSTATLHIETLSTCEAIYVSKVLYKGFKATLSRVPKHLNITINYTAKGV